MRISEGVVYDRHRDERSYIVIVKGGSYLNVPTRCTYYSSINYTREISKPIEINGEIIIIGKSGTEGLEGKFGWGGGRVKVRVKDGEKKILIWVKTKHTYAYIIVENAEILEVKIPEWTVKYSLAGVEILEKA